jgi:hypothetical protein
MRHCLFCRQEIRLAMSAMMGRRVPSAAELRRKATQGDAQRATYPQLSRDGAGDGGFPCLDPALATILGTVWDRTESGRLEFRWKRKPLPWRDTMAMLTADAVLEVMPYVEEFVRTLRGRKLEP